jgi:putative ABC transport system permease protein
VSWLRFLRRNDADREQREELVSYLEIATEENIARGMSRAEAREAARRKLGSDVRVCEEVYQMNTISLIDGMVRHGRQTARTLARNPMFAVATLLTLALGIGANTAVFSVINGVLLRPLPYPEPEQLISVQHTAPGAPGLISASGDLRLSASMYFTLADHSRSFQNIGAWTTGTATVTRMGDPEEVRVIAVTHGLLEALRVQPELGRWLSEADQAPGASRVLMLSYGYWQRRFGGDRGVLGRTMEVAALPRQVVGVMPRGFRVVETDSELIVPFQFDRAQLTIPGFFLQGIARLKPGVTIKEASADLVRLLPVWMDSWPAPPGVSRRSWEQWRITPALRPLKQDVVGRIQNGLWVVMATIGMVLLIACANVVNLLLVRTDARQKELAVRAALGAGRGRIVRELLFESLVLGLLGGVLGLALAFGVVKLLVAIGPASLPRLDEIAVDGRVLGFALAISVIAGAVLGLVPALKYAGRGLGGALGSEGRGASQSRQRHLAQNVLVVTQVALALVLLVSSGLMIRTFQALNRVDPGFTGPEQVETWRISVPPDLVAEPERVARTYQEIVNKLAAIPGVTSVGFATALPSDGLPPNWDGVQVEGQPLAPGRFPPMRRWKNISPGFLETMGTKLAAGRSFEWRDLLERRHVVMLSENMARELWGSAKAAVGQRIGPGPGRWHEVIGVVQDVYDNGVQEVAPATVYWPAYLDNVYVPGSPTVARNVAFTVRSSRTGSADFLRQVEQAVWQANSNLSMASIQTLADLHNRSLARTSFTLVMLAIAGGMALVLGVIGIYGVLAYTVTRRQREVGIRMALGAPPASVKLMFLRHGLVLTAIGVAAGLGTAAALSQWMSSLLFGVKPFDPVTYGSMAALLVAAAGAASYFPARRAAKVNPIETLQSE